MAEECPDRGSHAEESLLPVLEPVRIEAVELEAVELEVVELEAAVLGVAVLGVAAWAGLDSTIAQIGQSEEVG